MPHFIDSHAHLTSNDAIYNQVEDVLARAQAAGLTRIVNICTDPDALEKGLALVKKHPWIYNTAAIHPHDVAASDEASFEGIAAQGRSGGLVAIGETGLDYFYDHSPRAVQQEHLRRYLRLALECQLPVVIHCREAFPDFLRILDEEYVVNGKHAPGVLHCFTGTVKEAEEVLERGWHVSLSGIVTFKKSEELREVAKRVPMDRLLIETDSPYLAPQSKRGKPNEPSYLPEIAATIAQVKGLTLEEVAEATTNNSTLLFKI